MALRKFAKAALWFGISPHKRLKYLLKYQHRQAASGMHWSTELHGLGFFSCENSVVLGRRTYLNVQQTGRLIFKKGAWVGDDCEIDASGSVLIGAYTSLQHRSTILGNVSIGAGCACGSNLYISSSWHHFEDLPELPIRWQDAQASTKKSTSNVSRPVSIGDDCWIGINVVITPGVRIGRGCVIGANSVVTKNLPPYSIAAGSPAKVVRKRLDFSPPRNLNASVREHIPYFYSGFVQWGDGMYELTKALVNGGWETEKDFALALNTNKRDPIQMHVYAKEAGELRHGIEVIDVPPGESLLNFYAEPSDDGLLYFEWFSNRPKIRSSFIVIAAGKEL